MGKNSLNIFIAIKQKTISWMRFGREVHNFQYKKYIGGDFGCESRFLPSLSFG